MARPVKKGLDYFQADVDMFQDRKIKRLLRAAGPKGFTIYIYLLTCIYRDEGYLYEWDEHSAFDISDDLNFSENAVEESVRACCAIGLFNEMLYTEKSVLTSESIQDRWRKVVTDANRSIKTIEAEYRIIDGNPVMKSSPKAKPPPDNDQTKINGVPVPEVFQTPAFYKQYRKYIEYMMESFHKKVVPLKTEQDFNALFRLYQSDNDPVKVIEQTMVAGNKSFYALKGNYNQSNTQNNGTNNKRKTKGDEASEYLQHLANSR